MGHDNHGDNRKHWQNTSAFTLIELVTVLALMGLLLTGLAMLVNTTMEEVALLEAAPEEDVGPKLVSYLCKRLDEISTVVEWDSTRVQYLDQLGRRRNLDLGALYKAFSLQQNENQHSIPLYVNIQRLWGDEQSSQQLHINRGERAYLLTITLQEMEGVNEEVRIQQLINIRTK